MNRALLEDAQVTSPRRKEKLGSRIVEYNPEPENVASTAGMEARSQAMWTAVHGEQDPENRFYQERIDTIKQQQKELDLFYLEESTRAAPIYDEDDAVDFTEAVNDVERRYQEPYAGERAVLDTVATLDADGNPIEDSQLDQLAANWWISNEISRLGEGRKWYETLKEGLGTVFINDYTLDISRFLDETDDILPSLKTYANAPEMWQQFRAEFNSLSPQDQISQFSLLQEAILDATDGNRMKAAQYLSEMLEPSEDYAAFSRLDQAFLAADATYIGGIAAKVTGAGVLHGLSKLVAAGFQRNIVNTIRSSGNADLAARASALALDDPSGRLARQLNIQFPEEAILPYKFNAGSAEGVPITQDTIAYLHGINAAKARISNEAVPTPLTATEVESLTENLTKQLGDDLAVDNVRMLDSDGSFMTMQFETLDEFGEIVTKEQKFPIYPDAVNEALVTQGVTPFAGAVGSPAWKFAADKLTTVLPTTEAFFRQAKIRGELNGLYKEALRPLGGQFRNREQKRLLDEVLRLGDDFRAPDGTEGKVFSYEELVLEGLPELAGKKLTDAGYQSYVRLRGLMDLGFDLKNAEVRSAWEADGVMFARIGSEDNYVSPIKRRADTNTMVGSKAYDASVGKYVELTSEKLTELYDSGRMVARTQTPIVTRMADDGTPLDVANITILRADELQPLPDQVLRKKVGYVPRIAQDGFYFLRENNFGSINGTKTGTDGRPLVTGHSTLAVSATKRDVEAMRERLIADEIARLGTADPSDIRRIEEKYRVLADRQISPDEMLQEGFGYGSGLMTGARKEGGLRTPTGDRAERINAYESIQRMISNVSHSYPIQNVRKSLMNRWVATAKHHNAFADPRNTSFAGGRGNLKPGLEEDTKRMLESFHDYVSHVVSIPTDAERSIQNFTRRTAQFFETPGKYSKWMGMVADPIAKQLHRLDHSDPISALKAITFTTMLGGFNTSQLFVQGLGGVAISASLSPANLNAALKGSWTLAKFDQIPKGATRELYIEVAKANGKEIDSALLKAWDESGLAADVIADADMQYFLQNSNTAGGLIQQGAQASTYYYRMGELINRRFSFSSAVDWYRKENNLPMNYEFNRKDITNIMQRQQEIGLNLTRANKAAFQTNAYTSTFTQFQQVGAKYAETMMEPFLKGNAQSTLTKADIGRMFVIQGMTFGAAGFPLAKNVVQLVAGMSGMHPEDMDPQVVAAIEGGFLEYMMNRANIDNLVVTRLSPSEAVTGAFTSQLLGNPNSSWMDLFGASGSTLENFLNAGGSLAEAIAAAGTMEPDVFYPVLQSALVEFGNIFSTASSSFRAQMYLGGEVYDRRGRTITFPDEYEASLKTVVAQQLGLAVKVPSDLWELQKAMQDRQAVIDGVVDNTARILRDNRIYSGHEQGLSVIYFMIRKAKLSDEEALDVVERLDERMLGDSRWERTKDNFAKYLQKSPKMGINQSTVESAEEGRI